MKTNPEAFSGFVEKSIPTANWIGGWALDGFRLATWAPRKVGSRVLQMGRLGGENLGLKLEEEHYQEKKEKVKELMQDHGDNPSFARLGAQQILDITMSHCRSLITNREQVTTAFKELAILNLKECGAAEELVHEAMEGLRTYEAEAARTVRAPQIFVDSSS